MPITKKGEGRVSKSRQRGRQSASGDCSYPRVLPVNIDTIEVVVFDEVGDIGGHGQTISGSDAFPENHVSARVSRKRPPTYRQNAFCALDFLKLVEFIGCCDVGNLDHIGRG